MACPTDFQETLTKFTCVNGIFIYMDENGDVWEYDLNEKIIHPPDVLTVLNFDPLTKIFTYKDELGVIKPIDISDCIPKPSTFDYDPSTHTVIHNGTPHQLNCGVFGFNPLTCEITYTDEKGNFTSYIIPREQFTYDETNCVLVINPIPGADDCVCGPLVIPTGVPADQVCLDFVNGGKTLRLSYKDKTCDVQMPNSIIGCNYSVATNELRFIYCDGTEEAKALPKASLKCITLADGTQVLAFSNGCPGGDKMFNIPSVKIDTDNLTVVGSVLQFTYGGDGNPSAVNVDICQIIATHCNATITSQSATGFTFIDNAGNTFELEFANCCTYHSVTPNLLNPAAPPGAPSTPPASKNVGDTLVECSPNGLAFYTCDAAGWSLDYIKVFTDTIHSYINSTTVIDPAAPPAAPPGNPPKGEGFTAGVCYENGWCAFTCQGNTWVRNFCKVDPEIPKPPGPEVWIGVAPPPDKASGGGSYNTWFNCTDGCVYYCQDDGSWISPLAAAA